MNWLAKIIYKKHHVDNDYNDDKNEDSQSSWIITKDSTLYKLIDKENKNLQMHGIEFEVTLIKNSNDSYLVKF